MADAPCPGTLSAGSASQVLIDGGTPFSVGCQPTGGGRRRLRDESFWIKRYALNELEDLIWENKWKFTTGDVAYLRKIEEETENENFKRALAGARERMATGAREGPCVIQEKKGEEVEESSGP